MPIAVGYFHCSICYFMVGINVPQLTCPLKYSWALLQGIFGSPLPTENTGPKTKYDTRGNHCPRMRLQNTQPLSSPLLFPTNSCGIASVKYIGWNIKYNSWGLECYQPYTRSTQIIPVHPNLTRAWSPYEDSTVPSSQDATSPKKTASKWTIPSLTLYHSLHSALSYTHLLWPSLSFCALSAQH